MKRKEHRTLNRPAQGIRQPQPTCRTARNYPSLREFRKRKLGPAARLILAASLAVAAGCESPVCAPTRAGEIAQHAPHVGRDLLDLEPGNAIDQVLLGLGLRSHPALAGAMPMVVPPPGGSGGSVE